MQSDTGIKRGFYSWHLVLLQYGLQAFPWVMLIDERQGDRRPHKQTIGAFSKATYGILNRFPDNSSLPGCLTCGGENTMIYRHDQSWSSLD